MKRNARRLGFDKEAFCSLLSKKGYNDLSFSKVIGLSPPTIKKYKTGVATPTIKIINRLAIILGVSVAKLVFYSQECSEDKTDINTEKVKWVMTRKKVDSFDVAERSGLDPISVLGWVLGYKRVSYENIAKMAKAIGCDVKWFF